MRFLVVLFMLMTQVLTPLQYTLLGVLAGLCAAWDLWESFLKPAPAIVLTKLASQMAALQQTLSAPPPLEKMSELIAARTKCAQENNCEECKRYVAQFIGAPEPSMTEPPKACTTYEP